MPWTTNGGSDIRQLLRLAGVVAVQVVEDLPGFLVGERTAEAMPHLLNFLLPHGPVHGRRVARSVIEAVTDVAATLGHVAPGRVLQPHGLLLELSGYQRLRRPQP